MRLIGCDLHARRQTLAMLDTTTGDLGIKLENVKVEELGRAKKVKVQWRTWRFLDA